MSNYAFDFWNTLDKHEILRKLARELHAAGHGVHIVSAISPDLPMASIPVYAKMLKDFDIPWTEIHLVDHDPRLKVAVLKKIKAVGFWDDLPKNVIPAIEAGVPSCLVRYNVPLGLSALRANVTRDLYVPLPLEFAYVAAQRAKADDPVAPSDICEHLPVLRELASKCEHVTEFGTRRGNGSTLALLCGQPKRFVTWDVDARSVISPQLADYFNAGVNNGDPIGYVGRTKFEPRVGSTLEIRIEPTDLLFIDTLHTYTQLFAELMRHADPLEMNVRKYLAFHDTETFGAIGEDGQKPGLRTAIWHFQKQTLPQWGVKYDWHNNNGLIVLERADVSDEPGIWPDENHPRFK